MMAQCLKARFISEAFVQPGLQVVAQHVLVEELVEVEAVPCAPISRTQTASA